MESIGDVLARMKQHMSPPQNGATVSKTNGSPNTSHAEARGRASMASSLSADSGPRADVACPLCGGRGVCEREVEGEQVAYYVRDPQTKQDELRWRPRVQIVACACVMRSGLPTPDACGLAGLEELTLATFDESDLVAHGQGSAYAGVAAWVAGLPKSARQGGDTRGFIFHGRNGTGKTHLAAGIALAALRAGVRPRFLRESQFYARFSAAYQANEGDEGVVLALSSVALLLVDDVGKGYIRAGGGTPEEEASWRADRLEQVIEARLLAKRPTVLTTNVRLSDWPRRFGNALADRLNVLTPLYFGGESRR